MSVHGVKAACLFFCALILLCSSPAAKEQVDEEEQAIAESAIAQTPEQRKAARAAELQTLTSDIKLSSERQAEIAREIRAIGRDRDALNADLLRTAQRVQGLEEQLAATEDRFRRLSENEDKVRASFAERQDTLAEILSALQRIGQRPPPALAVRPQDAVSAIRSAILLNAVMPEIQVEAQALASDLSELKRLKTSIAAERERLASDGARLKEEQTRVELLIAAKKHQIDKSQRLLESEKQRSQELAKKATSLQGLIASLENEIDSAKRAAEQARVADEKRKAEAAEAGPGRLAPAMAFTKTKEQLSLPVAGAPIRNYGDPDGFGGTTEGLSLAARSGAQVIAPADGWVVYAGPFRSYGQLLILNAGDGYHILLAGMDRVDVELGQFVLAGEPVAAMGSTRVSSAESSNLAAKQPVLYVEFRKDGIAIDPTPWWHRTKEKKVRG